MQKLTSAAKRIAALSLCTVLLFCLFGCGKKDAAQGGGKTQLGTTAAAPADDESSRSDKDLLDAIYRQNRLDALLLNHRNVQRTTVCYDTSGKKVFTSNVFGDRGQYAYSDSEGNITVIEKGTQVGYDAQKKQVYRTAFAGGAYQKYADSNRNHIIFTGYSGENVITSAINNDDSEWVITTKIPMSSIDQNASVYSPGVTFAKDDTCTIEYHVTPYLYEIRKMRITVVRANAEKSVRLMDTSISYDGARYSLPSWLQERLNSGRGVVSRYVR